jgi:serine/threonine-protein kinase ATR
MNCSICDVPNPPQREEKTYWNNSDSGEDWKDAIAAMLIITENSWFRDGSYCRIQMALAIRRVFNHISDPDYLNLDHCALGQWLLKSLNRSMRELRIAAS